MTGCGRPVDESKLPFDRLTFLEYAWTNSQYLGGAPTVSYHPKGSVQPSDLAIVSYVQVDSDRNCFLGCAASYRDSLIDYQVSLPPDADSILGGAGDLASDTVAIPSVVQLSEPRRFCIVIEQQNSHSSYIWSEAAHIPERMIDLHRFLLGLSGGPKTRTNHRVNFTQYINLIWSHDEPLMAKKAAGYPIRTSDSSSH
jgi:hypothetical protein